MNAFGINHCALSLGAAATLLAGCVGSQPPLSAPQGLAPSQLAIGRQAYHIIHPFGRSTGDGKNPAADLIDIKGTLYGTTAKGGSYGGGTVFSITPSGKETVLYSFGGVPNDGYAPMAAVLNVNGTLYGTTSAGGTQNGGTVFKITPSGKETVLHRFAFLGNGNPLAALINVDGTLYGTTAGLTGYWCGEAFSITTGGKFNVLHRFGHGNDGCSPLAPLLNVDGTLYGTASQGGEGPGGEGFGTVFTITTAGEYQTLYKFRTNPNDGEYPAAALINVQGTLYGTTTGGGVSGGTVFSITTGGLEKTVYSFGQSRGDGSGPSAALKNVKGVLYGTTGGGGVNNLGTVFRLTKSGKETVVHSFAKGHGVDSVAGVIAVDGALYGTTYGKFPGLLPKRSFGNVFSLTL